MMEVQGRTAIVTGAGNGIGRATAARLGQAGANVVVVDIEPAAARESAVQIQSFGGSAIAIEADVSKEADLRGVVERAVTEFGHLNILINNAFWTRSAAAVDLEGGDWDRTVAVTLRATWEGSKYALPHMVGTDGACIVNISSIESVIGFPGSAAYAAAKGGVNALTRQLAAEFGPQGVRVNAILPGSIRTRGWDNYEPGYEEAQAKRVPLRRLGTPEEIAGVALFLASDEASYINGACILVDGGRTSSA